MKPTLISRLAVLLTTTLLLATSLQAAETPFLYGIFNGGDPDPADASEYLGHLTSGAGPGWVTVTVSIGANTNYTWGKDYRFLSNLGHTVICRINHGYFPIGTIPLTNKYDDFAIRCASFAANSQGCSIWTIGNELNISGEWPFDTNRNVAPFVTPAEYARCYRKVYNAIKAVRPNDTVLPQAPACFAGPFNAGSNPYGPNNFPFEANPLTWVQYLNQMLTAITTTGPNPRPPDGVALHLASRGYTCSAIHSTTKFGNGLYNSFYIYKDWVDSGIPSSLYSLPLYATECNGYYYWNGGHPESPLSHYEAGWMQEVYAEISRYNQTAVATGKPVYRCVNMYQWPNGYDNWNINGGLFKEDILADLDIAVAQRYIWPSNYATMLVPVGLNFIHPGSLDDSVPNCGSAGVSPQTGWTNLTSGGTGNNVPIPGGMTATWSTPGGGTHEFATMAGYYPADDALMQGYLDTGDATTSTVTLNNIKFRLYDVIVYCDGDNGGATRVGRYILSGATSGNATRYVGDAADSNFYGIYTEVDSPTGGASTPAGNYCRFRNVRGATFTISATGNYGSDAHPRAPLNALQVIPVNVIPTLSGPVYSSGQFEFFLNGATNITYTIQASTNLLNWDNLTTRVAPAQVSLSSAGYRYRYFRALFQ